MNFKKISRGLHRRKKFLRINLSKSILSLEIGIIWVIGVLSFLLSSCNEKSNVVDVSNLPKATGQVVSDTNYIQIQPSWGGFNNPRSIKIGYDYILYITEPDSNRIVMVDLAGTNLGHSQHVKRPVAITQDRSFNLIIASEYDTTIIGNGQDRKSVV